MFRYGLFDCNVIVPLPICSYNQFYVNSISQKEEEKKTVFDTIQLLFCQPISVHGGWNRKMWNGNFQCISDLEIIKSDMNT